MPPPNPPLLTNSFSHLLDDISPAQAPQTELDDLSESLQEEVNAILDPYSPSDMEPLLLPRSQAAPPPDQVHNLTSSNARKPAPPTFHQPTAPRRIPPFTPQVHPRTPQIPPRTPVVQTTPHLSTHASPMSIATPLSSAYPTTPQTTPTYPPLTPVSSPEDEEIAAFSAAIGDVPDQVVQSHFDAAIDRAAAVAKARKKKRREQLKRDPNQTGTNAEQASRREAKLSREKQKFFEDAVKGELRKEIRKSCVYKNYIDTFLPEEHDKARKRARTGE